MLNTRVFTLFFHACFLAVSVVPKSHVSEQELCLPLLPTPEKVNTLKNFLNNTAPLNFWHLQKSGGSAFCFMMRREYSQNHEAIKVESIDCNAHAFGIEIIQNFSSWDRIFKPKGYLFVAMEPSNSDSKKFPLKYHSKLETQILLNESYGEKHQQAWANIVHVLVIRHPIDMAISAFNYKFQGTSHSIHAACVENNITADACMQELFMLKENPNITSHKLFDEQQLNRIRTEILGSYMIETFSLEGRLEVAKNFLRRFSLIVDLSLSSITSALLTCTLGWSTVRYTALNNVNTKHPTQAIFESLNSDTLKKLAHYLQQDIFLYGMDIHLWKV